MDAADDDQDVKLQRASADLLEDFRSSIKPFLWKTTKSGRTQIRSQVRTRDTERLVNLLEPFQELPQLLDPHLDKFVPVLADAFLASLQASTRTNPTTNAQLLMPISKAICKLLYTFCKIRGDKVIVRFWSTETRYLELLLTAIESNKPAADAPKEQNASVWEWEERYITLLWLSQLLLAPFDLSSISSNDAEDVVIPIVPGLSWPTNVPTITLRAISLGIQYLSSSGKERDAAKILLVRIAMRRDMQSLGIQDALLRWAMTCLQPSTDPNHSTYHYIGVLSFLAAILVSSVGTTNMDSFVQPISQVIQSITTEDSLGFIAIRGSAVARKVLIKILRTVVVLLLQDTDPPPEMIEFTIGHMLESLADAATPVRLAASKALSIITLKLPSEMADQVVEEVLDSLKKNLLWTQKGGRKIRNLSRVNPLEWHGLTLTLSHLVYRQSVPSKDLAPVLDALRLALSFEQRSTSGASIGTNVRDAACFGIWAVARRYKTTDLENLHLSPDVTTDSEVEASVSALQTLANDLVVSACVDPAGNIRRGSSAALQELIGRHPDTVLEGIQVVQVVDYHAVALRTRAISDVAVKSAELSEEYREAILQALLGWRGVRDGNPATRKVAASTFGELIWQRHLALSPSWRYFQSAIDEVARQVKQLESREINERHGLILAFSELVVRVTSELKVDNLHAEFHRIQKHETEGVPQDPESKEESGLYTTLVNINYYLIEFLKDFQKQAQNSRQQDLLAEAFSELVVATSSIPRRLTLFGKFDELRKRDTNDASGCGEHCWIRQLISSPLDLKPNLHQYILDTEFDLITKFMKNANVTNFGIISAAAERFIVIESGLSEQTQKSALMIGQWIIDVASTRGHKDMVYIQALISLFSLLKTKLRDTAELHKVWVALFQKPTSMSMDLPAENWQSIALYAVLERWEQDLNVETRTTILQCLARASKLRCHKTLLEVHAFSFMRPIEEGLHDFTTNARGDVGSQVRIAAARATTALLSLLMNDHLRKSLDECVMGGILRIAAEKLDKVRLEGQATLARWNEFTANLTALDPSSQAYFSYLLNLQTQEWWMVNPQSTNWTLSLLGGYVTSADAGSEDLVRASRTALVEFCNDGHVDLICLQLSELATSNVDRVLIPTLEVIGFLFDMQIMQKSSLSFKKLFKIVAIAVYRSSNVRKLQAAIKIYGGMSEVLPEATTKLSAMLLHNYPQIRNAAADELWIANGVGKGVDWAKAKKSDLDRVRAEISQLRPVD